MRVLFACYPEKTHFLAMAPLAWALRAAGHDVCFASQPKFVPEITRAGLTAVAVGGNRDLWQVMTRDPDWLDNGVAGWPEPYAAADETDTSAITWERLHDGYAFQVTRWHKMTNVPLMADLVEFARQWRPDLVLWEPSTYAAAVAAKACGAAHGRVLFGVDVFGVTRERFLRLRDERSGERRSDPLAEWLGAYAGKYGTEFGEDLVTGQFSVDLMPRFLQTEAALKYVPVRYTPYGGAAVVPQWLRDEPERPRVALTTGLSSAEYDTEHAVRARDVLDALTGLDVEVVATVSAGAREGLGPVPDRVRLVEFVPMQPLLATCSAIVHHGGFGSLCTAALQGVPQLVLPYDCDEPVLAERLAARGGALALHATRATADGIRERVRRLLTEPSFARCAEDVRRELAAVPGPHQLVKRLEDLAARHRRRR
ncbi:activator-dependent family glycosyltransferase [Streptomyces sp. AK010]|uniref:activator-dependent family glycosyltransferase n=1 Tax=Streptomyces sp. AK010 TaxID=2723074 RepID=UPI001616B202|nr:activator-dependent family glycosyltransferase [Streptomyces sp. AK010]MBB6421386.1 glycosyltransferase (activator-dependent family) [Streptomyces sp. AK010]